MLADHLPHELAIEWYYAQPLLIVVLAIVAVVGLISGPHRSTPARVLLGVGTGLAVILPTMTWGYCAESRGALGLLALLLASPALVALGHRVIPRRLADVLFVVASCAVLAMFLVGQAVGCWRDDSYIDDDANLYVVLVALPMVASWLWAWGWSHPARARAMLTQLASLPSRAIAPLTRLHAAKDVGAMRPAPSAAQVQRAHALARMAIAPMVVGAILIPTVLGAPPGVIVLGSAWVVRRASRPVRAGRAEWSKRSVIGLVFAALLTAGGGSWLLIWAIQKNFSFSSEWSSVGLAVGLAWSVVFTVLIVRSLRDRRSNKAAATSESSNDTTSSLA